MTGFEKQRAHLKTAGLLIAIFRDLIGLGFAICPLHHQVPAMEWAVHLPIETY
jgi:hypothetical protein